jgi:hypothetical protein
VRKNQNTLHRDRNLNQILFLLAVSQGNNHGNTDATDTTEALRRKATGKIKGVKF